MRSIDITVSCVYPMYSYYVSMYYVSYKYILCIAVKLILLPLSPGFDIINDQTKIVLLTYGAIRFEIEMASYGFNI